MDQQMAERFKEHFGKNVDANWINVGRTGGRSKKSTSNKALIPLKDIWLYPLRKNFAAVLLQ